MNSSKINKDIEEEDDALPFSEEYERMYQFIKMVEEKAAKQMLKQQQYYDDNLENTPKKIKK